jgi:hypothetical protein
VTANRALSFTATDGALDGSQADIVLTASVSGIPSPTYAWTFSGLQTNPTASTTSSQTITAAQFGTSKSATVTCTVNGSYVDQVTIVRLEKSTAAAGATVGAEFGKNITGQITPSNVTTYIANAAIGNAQIGGDIWSSNFVAGSAGWRIYRSGSAEFRNVTVRGDVEATSIKADAANIVNTLNVAGNAITTPLAGSIAALTVNQTVTNTYTYSRTLGTITTSSQGRGQVLILITPYKDEPLAQAFTASDYPDALVATRITRNGITIFETTDSGDAASTNLSGAAYLDTPGAGVACTYAVVTYTYRGSGSAQFSQSHRIAQASFFIMEFKK